MKIARAQIDSMRCFPRHTIKQGASAIIQKFAGAVIPDVGQLNNAKYLLRSDQMLGGSSPKSKGTIRKIRSLVLFHSHKMQGQGENFST